MNLSQAVSIEDLRQMARRRLPRTIFDYIDGGAEGEVTLDENRKAFREVVFRPRAGFAFSDYSLKTSVLGQELSFPALLAPVGYSRVINRRGEVAAAAAAGKAGIAYILSTISGHKLEDVKAATNGPAWYQLYFVGGREIAEASLDRAKRAGFSALVVTMDTPVAGMRERDMRNGMKELLGESLWAKLPYVPDVLAHPRWLMDFLLDGGMPKLQNCLVPEAVLGKGASQGPKNGGPPNERPPKFVPMPIVGVQLALSRAAVKWADLKWIREAWPGPIVIKGLLTADDARHAVDAGAAAVVVSNHGGRQLDSVEATMRVLPEVVSAVNGQAEVLMDGGVRRGADIVKALCMGARAVLLGRAYAYGLGAAGEAGVSRAIEILRTDVDRTLRLLGCEAVTSLDGSFIQVAGRC